MSNNFQSDFKSFDFPRASLFTQAPEAEKERSSFQWSVFNGNPRITVWTRVPSDKDKPPISVGIGMTAFMELTAAMEAIFRGPPGGAEAMVTNGYPKDLDPSQTSRQMVPLSTLRYGRDAEGICWVSLESNTEDRPKIVFRWTGNNFHNFRDKSGPLTQDVASQRQAIGDMNYLRTVMTNHDRGVTPEERKAFTERMKANRSGKGGGGGQNRSQQRPQSDGGTSGFSDSDFQF